MKIPPAKNKFQALGSPDWSYRIAILIGVVLLGSGCASTRQTTFASPQEAADALIAALRPRDPTRLKLILGPEADDVISSGDAVADQRGAERFLAAYDEKHALVAEPDGRMTLQVGAEDWPLPIPIVASEGKWRFDTEAGKDELLSRRIGRNELYAIQVCQAIVDAQHEYALLDPNGNGVKEYAQKIISDPGKRNGLYWESPEGEPPSPLGPLVAEATEEGYGSRRGSGEPQPFHGYYYGLLTSQSSSARGGQLDYLVRGLMIGGFGVVAYPADYDNSGIMTFIVNREGVVYQKDLGPETANLARKMTQFDPDSSWIAVPAS